MVDSSKSADKRAAIRYAADPESFSAENSCRPITAPQRDSWSAVVRDLSTTGIGLAVNRRFEPGTLLTVELQDAQQTTSRSLLVRVARTTQENRMMWLLGCTFLNQLSESELLSLM